MAFKRSGGPAGRWIYESVAEPLPHDDDKTDANHDLRFLPPGCLSDYFVMFKGEGGIASWSHFKRIWTKYFFNKKLDFRTGFQHAVCTVCVQHKLILGSLGHDTVARHNQRLAYEKHLNSQYMDRQVYWRLRGISRQCGQEITFIRKGFALCRRPPL